MTKPTRKQWKDAVARHAFELDVEGKRSEIRQVTRREALDARKSAKKALERLVDGALRQLGQMQELKPEFGSHAYVTMVHRLIDRLEKEPARIQRKIDGLNATGNVIFGGDSFPSSREYDQVRSLERQLDQVPELRAELRDALKGYEYFDGIVCAYSAAFEEFGVDPTDLGNRFLNELDDLARADGATLSPELASA